MGGGRWKMGESQCLWGVWVCEMGGGKGRTADYGRWRRGDWVDGYNGWPGKGLLGQKGQVKNWGCGIFILLGTENNIVKVHIL